MLLLFFILNNYFSLTIVFIYLITFIYFYFEMNETISKDEFKINNINKKNKKIKRK